MSDCGFSSVASAGSARHHVHVGGPLSTSSKEASSVVSRLSDIQKHPVNVWVELWRRSRMASKPPWRDRVPAKRITRRAGRVGELEAAKVEDQAATFLFSSPQLFFELLHTDYVELAE
jgi:hypothetical protein